MQYRVDLHTHSTASDGQYTPSQVVHMARQAGIQILALTDHDTLSGLDEAAQTAREIGLFFIKGAELAAREHRNLHLLAYHFQDSPTPLSRLCEQLQQGRRERSARILDYLRERGVPLTPEEVHGPGRPHFAQALVARHYVQNTREAFDKYLDTPEFSSIERPKPTAQACIEAIKGAGGYAAFAHPYQLQYDEESLEKLVIHLKFCGLDAIECYYPRHTPAQTALYLSLARKYDLRVTAGSDFHGERVKPDVHLTPWPLELPDLQLPDGPL
ncbi:MAG: PHP domain-containing protein [Oscillospiraceae bacterium]|nr:PHP domain-containing protein [Oscillospiraceae bacterium]